MCVCVPAILMHLKSNYGMLGTHTPAISWGQVVQGYKAGKGTREQPVQDQMIWIDAVKQGLQSHCSLLTPESMQPHEMQCKSCATCPSKYEDPGERRFS